jgi:hypothetical protein
MSVDKGQLARLFDVFMLGPYLIWYAATTSKPRIFRAILITIGVTTITYNGHNFLANVFKFKGTSDIVSAAIFLVILCIALFIV